MKTTPLFLIVGALLVIAACSTSQKSTTSAPVAKSAEPAPATATVAPLTNTVSSVMVPKSTTGIYAPGDEELAAIQTKYKDVTMDKLKDGYMLYTQGACVNCHRAKSIYRFSEAHWYSIIEDMARRANIGDAQKDAVYKYVLAVKAVQPK